jgi:LuxR family transcriptional regulator, maltose regulon positive regulatory protein
LGSRGTVLREAAGAFVVALAARLSWFCYHQLFAVLLRFDRRRIGLAEMAALHWAFSWTRAGGS